MGTQLPLPKKEAEPPPQFSAHVYCGQTAGWIKIALGMEVGLGGILRFGKLSRIEIVYYTILYVHWFLSLDL